MTYLDSLNLILYNWVDFIIYAILIGEIVAIGFVFRGAWKRRNNANIEYDSWGKP